jgi:hypothetical protein
MTYYIEDILHLLIDTVGVVESDRGILHSISAQCKRGIALTDRQYDLVVNKIQNYKTQLEQHNCTMLDDLPTRVPLREIDRSKTISVVSHTDMVGPNGAYESYKEKWQWIKVRFPFSKKLIAKLDTVKTNSKEYHHEKGSNKHYFKLNGKTLVKLVDMFKSSSFTIDDCVVDYYHKSQQILDNSDQYVSRYENNRFYNLNEETVKQLTAYNNELIVADRRIRHGYKTSLIDRNDSLAETIAFRTSQNVKIDPDQYSLCNIADALRQLDRFPVIVQIDNTDSFEQLQAFHHAFDFVDNRLQSVLFRAEGDDTKNHQLNQYVKDNNLNNWVDNTTKIVYIKKNQLPKVLLNSDFLPITSISITSHRSNQHVDTYCKFHCDLIIHHDTESSMFNTKFGTYQYAHL